MTAALRRPGHKPDRAEFEIKVNWYRKNYFRMSPTELEIALNKATGLNRKGDSWRRMAARYGLKNSRHIGRPENQNMLPAAV